jgi:5-methyltetrahydrofolate--homocysteine methyltransferase
MSRFSELLHSGRVLLMDGAMGTELQRAGIQEGECYEQWNVTHPGRVRAIHQAYVDAGAECLVTNTFQANWSALRKYGLEKQVEAINFAALDLVESACKSAHFVLGDIGPAPWPIWPGAWGRQPFRELVLLLRRANGLLLETWSHPRALLFVKHVYWETALRPEDLPVLLSIAYQRNPDGSLTTPGGHKPERFARQARAYGVAALGVNCGRDIGMDEILEIVLRYRQVTDLPLFARPNAGTPIRLGDQWIYPHTPEKMAARLPELLEAGVTLVGGCCGTTPEHIAAFRSIIDDWNARHGK